MVAEGTACPRDLYLCAGQRVLVHKSLDKLLWPDVSQAFLRGEGKEESNRKLWGPGTVLLRATASWATPRGSLGTCPSHWGSATLFWVVTDLRTIPPFPCSGAASVHGERRGGSEGRRGGAMSP